MQLTALENTDHCSDAGVLTAVLRR